MKKILTISLALVIVGTLGWLLLPRFSAYREWLTKTDIRISNSTQMEIQDAWITQSSDNRRLFRIRARWIGTMPFEQKFVTTLLTDKSGEPVHDKKWYVPLPIGPDNENGHLFIWEFEVIPGKKLDNKLTLQVRVHPNKNQASTPIVTNVPLHFFGVVTSSSSIFPFRKDQ
ncbi:MAG TPA: hypothetical protein VIO38_02260 [Rariglobus sp.]